METIKDFFEDVRNRLTNPFISSFIIAWMVSNWQITIAILYYNDEDNRITNSLSLIDFISQHLFIANMIIYPLLAAVIYTFGFPHFRAYIQRFQAGINTTNDDKILNITKEGHMPVTRYIKLKEDYAQKIDEISKIALDESKLVEINNNLITSLETQKAENERIVKEFNTVNEQLSEWGAFNDIGLLNDTWQLEVIENSRVTNSAVFTIINQEATLTETGVETQYQIEYYICNIKTKNLSFILIPKHLLHHSLSFHLKFDDKELVTQLAGMINETGKKPRRVVISKLKQ